MLYFLRFLSLSLVGCLLCIPAAQARDWQTIKASGKLIAGSEGTFFPFNYFENQKLTGYEIDLAETLAHRLGVALEWRTFSFEALIPAVRQERIDFAIAAHSYTEERAIQVDFAQPHACTNAQIISHKNSALRRDALQGKFIGVQVSTSYFAAAKKINGVRGIKTYRSDHEAFLALKEGKVDAWITDHWLAALTLAKDPDNTLALGELLWPERYGIILRKNNTEFLKKINATLDEMNRDGSLLKLAKKYALDGILCTP